MPILREAFAELPGSLCRVALETQQNAFLRVALETQHNAFLNSMHRSLRVALQGRVLN
ncbi:hypothetical protein [Leptospira noguchii]|uniref:hypothetical protein n=1 Tax=Leptospira noguchii TaxID=28182 RepID=UPI0015EED90E|nr:hypothetical protein [Leptospira noguchii]UOG51912.1 hypothetical protein MAL09_14870 [Leptospira noguchii]